MKTMLCFTLCALALSASVDAKQYNKPKRLDADGQSTVNKVIADAYRTEAVVNSQASRLQSGCSANVNVGNVTVPQGGIAPREVTTVILGDVINVNRGCR